MTEQKPHLVLVVYQGENKKPPKKKHFGKTNGSKTCADHLHKKEIQLLIKTQKNRKPVL